MKNNLNELKATLEEIRKSNYPDIPAEVIDEIVDVQNQYKDDPPKRQTETQKIILKYANNIQPDEGGKA